MKTAEQIAEKLWEKHANDFGNIAMNHDDFLTALREYGELVRQRAAGIAGVAEEGHRALKDAHERNTNRPFDHRDFGINMDVVKYSGATAAAIERMELP